MTILYSLALLVSAALLFLLEPMVGKFVLPLLGSSPEVWPTTVLFFQAALLAGYSFAHVTSRLLAPRRQALLQIGVLVAGRGSAADRGAGGHSARQRQPGALAAPAARDDGGAALLRAGRQRAR